MSLPSISRSSPFTRAVVQAMRKLYPESIADKSFDNTGLLLEAPFLPNSSSTGKRQKNSVLLTIDLTRAVADEAIARRDSVVVAYHPIIFRGLKAVTLADSQQQSLLRLAAAGISVYSPHTAVDAAPGGLGDWMADIVTGTPVGGGIEESNNKKTAAAAGDSRGPAQDVEKKDLAESDFTARPGVQRTYSTPTYPTGFGGSGRATPATSSSSSGSLAHTRRALQPVRSPPAGFEEAGVGRLVTFSEAQPLGSLVDRIARGVGSPKGFPVAVPQYPPQSSSAAVTGEDKELNVRTVAICAGSGGDVFRGVEADLYFTGELSHHQALAITEAGSAVVTLFHSNSERGFLHDVLRAQLAGAVEKEWAAVRREEREKQPSSQSQDGQSSEWAQMLDDEGVQVDVSERDRDPYGIVVLRED